MSRISFGAPRNQRGVILFIALIVLVAMSLAGIALMRSVDTNVLIAGNLAFRQGATLAADRGIEDAKNWLAANAAGVTLFEALKAYDILKTAGISVRVIDLYSVVPIDRTTLLDCARATQGRILTVEDHYAHGGLGDAVLSAVGSEGIKVHKLAVRTIPHSGKPDELVDHFGIGARSIVEAAKRITK